MPAPCLFISAAGFLRSASELLTSGTELPKSEGQCPCGCSVLFQLHFPFHWQLLAGKALRSPFLGPLGVSEDTVPLQQDQIFLSSIRGKIRILLKQHKAQGEVGTQHPHTYPGGSWHEMKEGRSLIFNFPPRCFCSFSISVHTVYHPHPNGLCRGDSGTQPWYSRSKGTKQG